MPERLRVVLISLLLPAAIATGQEAEPAAAVEERWLGSGGQPLPFQTEEELLSFLRDAAIVSQKEVAAGINRPLKVRLERDGVAANGIFRIADIKRKRAKLDGKLIADFHDSFIYECAAYEVSRLLGLDNVPPCVYRRIERTEGTLQLWVEGARTEKQRRDAGETPPRALEWLRQKQTMRLFDALIYNFDRNLGNMLVDSQWKLWFIDHTRSFRSSSTIEAMEKIVWCERDIWNRLQGLEKSQLSRRMRSEVSPRRIQTMFNRRDKLVAYLRNRIERIGEDSVLYDAGSGDSGIAGLSLAIDDDDYPETSSKLEDP